MNMKNLFSTGLMALAIVSTSDCVFAGTATPESIMVIPARKRMVQLAFQIARCKEVGLVTYNTSPTLAAPLIHAWNGQEWIQVSLEDYVDGRFMSGDPKHVFLLGDTSSLPLKMMDGPTWYKDLSRITTLDTASILNQVGNVLHFSAHQWKWLAESNGLNLEDKSSERRRYGRWGAPGKEQELAPQNKADSVMMPPAPIITTPAVTPKEVKMPPMKVETDNVKSTPAKGEMPVPPKEVVPPVTEKPVTAVPITVKVEPTKVEPVKVEPTKVEPTKVELPKVEPAKPEVSVVEEAEEETAAP
ncbi:MAG: hypothetical protein WCO42_05885 [bacterium]